MTMGAEPVVTRVWTQEELLREVPRGGMAARVELAPGDVIGDVKILEFYDRTSNGLKRYLVRCECGDVFVRLGSKILQAARKGGTPSCHSCLIRLRKLNWELKGDDRRYIYRKLFFNTGSLYSRGATERLQAQVLEDLEREIAPMRDMDAEAMCPSGEEPSPRNRSGFWVDPTRNDSRWVEDPNRVREREEAALSRRARAAFLERQEVLLTALGEYTGSKFPVPAPGSHEARGRFKTPWESIPLPSKVMDAWNRPCVCGSDTPFCKCCGAYDSCPCGSGRPFRSCHGASKLPSPTWKKKTQKPETRPFVFDAPEIAPTQRLYVTHDRKYGTRKTHENLAAAEKEKGRDWKMIDIVEYVPTAVSRSAKAAKVKSETQHFSAYVGQRAEAMTTRPTMWGGPEAVEPQLMLLLEFEALARHGVLIHIHFIWMEALRQVRGESLASSLSATHSGEQFGPAAKAVFDIARALSMDPRSVSEDGEGRYG